MDNKLIPNQDRPERTMTAPGHTEKRPADSRYYGLATDQEKLIDYYLECTTDIYYLKRKILQLESTIEETNRIIESCLNRSGGTGKAALIAIYQHLNQNRNEPAAAPHRPRQYL